MLKKWEKSLAPYTEIVPPEGQWSRPMVEAECRGGGSVLREGAVSLLHTSLGVK